MVSDVTARKLVKYACYYFDFVLLLQMQKKARKQKEIESIKQKELERQERKEAQVMTQQFKIYFLA